MSLFTASVHGLAENYYNAEQIAAWAPARPDLTAWRERLERFSTIVAGDHGELVGFLSYEPNGHIDLLFVSPFHARCGVASMLYREAESTLISSGVKALHTDASLLARPFFERRGFIVQEEQVVNRQGVTLRRYDMRKPMSIAQQGAAADAKAATRFRPG
ncbi:MAG TPA: GNAT family N-acetyltransferase [Nevskiaceae bacterium]|nr:GNAT family N-acetyltransferase [Nevskiaceae bacterium]